MSTDGIPFDLQDACLLLARTPAVLRAQLGGLPEAWLRATEGPDTWSPFDVLGHLIHGERTDWLQRIGIILQHGDSVAFNTFDREAMFRDSAGKGLDLLLDEFAALREANLSQLDALRLSPQQLDLPGRHPQLGAVTMRQLLATWAAHDLGHLVQINRVLARQYRAEVGPWREYLSVMR